MLEYSGLLRGFILAKEIWANGPGFRPKSTKRLDLADETVQNGFGPPYSQKSAEAAVTGNAALPAPDILDGLIRARRPLR